MEEMGKASAMRSRRRQGSRGPRVMGFGREEEGLWVVGCVRLGQALTDVGVSGGGFGQEDEGGGSR